MTTAKWEKGKELVERRELLAKEIQHLKTCDDLSNYAGINYHFSESFLQYFRRIGVEDLEKQHRAVCQEFNNL